MKIETFEAAYTIMMDIREHNKALVQIEEYQRKIEGWKEPGNSKEGFVKLDGHDYPIEIFRSTIQPLINYHCDQIEKLTRDLDLV